MYTKEQSQITWELQLQDDGFKDQLINIASHFYPKLVVQNS